MYKIATTAVISLLLVGCQTGKESGKDWLDTKNGCEKYFSETAYDLKACKNYLAAKEGKKK